MCGLDLQTAATEAAADTMKDGIVETGETPVLRLTITILVIGTVIDLVGIERTE